MYYFHNSSFCYSFHSHLLPLAVWPKEQFFLVCASLQKLRSFDKESAFIRMARTRTAPTSSKTLTSKVQKRPRPNQNQPKYRNFIKAVLKDEYELLSISKSSVEVLNHLFIELVDKFSNEMMKLAKKQGRTQVNKNDAVAAVKLLMGNEGGDAKAIENEIRKKLRENNY